jgi:gliding motility-associated-like protein
MADNAIQHTFSTTGEHLIAIDVQNEYGCSSNAESMVMVHPLPEVISEPVFNTPCVGELLEFQIEASIAPPYSIASHAWSFSNGELSFGAVGSFETTEAGTMHAVVTLQSDAGCTTYIELNDAIEVAPLPHSAFTVSPEQVHISTPVVDVQDQSLNALNWLYHLGDGNESTAPNFRHTYLQTGTYTVTQTVISEDGCTASSTATINVSGYLVFVPNAFTPNNDGRNERFMPSIFGDDILEYEFLIINRWGEEVFRTNDPTDGWNGNGKDGSTHYAINDVYVWLIRIKGAMGYREEFNGSVTLIR